MNYPINTKLFCIPHAGGSATYYSRFKDFFSEGIDVRPLEMAGRGRRCRDPLSTSMDVISGDLFAQIEPVVRSHPYALFGHSMGGLLALLCALRAREKDLPLPEALFVSACATPDTFLNKPAVPVSSFPPDQLWRFIRELGGLPPAVAMSKELCQYLEPVLYADFTALDTWNPAEIDPLPVPITVFLGSEDLLQKSTACEWSKLTTREFSIHSFPGNHFYLQDNWDALATLIAQTLAPSGLNAAQSCHRAAQPRE